MAYGGGPKFLNVDRFAKAHLRLTPFFGVVLQTIFFPKMDHVEFSPWPDIWFSPNEQIPTHQAPWLGNFKIPMIAGLQMPFTFSILIAFFDFRERGSPLVPQSIQSQMLNG